MRRALGAFCVLLAPLVGCSGEQETSVTVVEREEPAPAEAEGPTAEGDMQIVTVRTNTQETVGDLRIGAGNIWEDTYETQGGNTATGLGAGISVFVRDDERQNVRARVHAGDTLDVGGRRIAVRDITADAVVLAIGP